jgi:hypothetical protein
MIKTLSSVRYHMDMGCGLDVWRISGIDDNGKVKLPSTPIEFDEENDILKTVSGSVYHIGNFSCDRSAFVEQVKKDIKNKSYEVH